MKKFLEDKNAFEQRFQDALAAEGISTEVELTLVDFGGVSTVKARFEPAITLKVGSSNDPFRGSWEVLTRAGEHAGFFYGYPLQQHYARVKSEGFYEISEAGFETKREE